MSKKKNLSTNKRNQQKEIMNKIYSISLKLAEISITILINHFMK